MGGMLTEFSVASLGHNEPGGKGTLREPKLGNAQDMLNTMDVADDQLFSWLGWEYKIFWPITGASFSIFHPDGSINHEYLASLTRTYPQAVAGRTQGFKFNNATAEFNLNYTTTAASQD
jgi:endoglycosylceramidase